MAGMTGKGYPPAEEFGTRLKQLRIAAGLSQAELARMTHRHHSHVIAWERHKCIPRWQVACLLADALGVSVEAFRAGTFNRIAQAVEQLK